LCKFDGFGFTGDFTTDSLPAAFVKKILKDRNGNLWFGHNDGSITMYDGKEFRIISTDEKISSTINDMVEDPRGFILFATQNQGIIAVDSNLNAKIIVEPFRRKLLSSLCFTEDANLLVGAYDGLHLYEFDPFNDTAIVISKISEIPYTTVNTICKRKDGSAYLIGTQDEGIYCLKISDNANYEVSKLETGSYLKYSSVLGVLEDRHNHIWLSTQGEGVYKIDLSPDSKNISNLVNFNERNGLGNLFIREVFEDIEGNIWISTYGNGLAALFDEAFIYYTFENEIGSDIYSVVADDDVFWIGGENRIMQVSQSQEIKNVVFGPADGIPRDKIISLYNDNKGWLWIGTSQSGLFRMNLNTNKATRFHASENSLENVINAIDGNDNFIWVGTNNGVIQIDTKTGEKISYTTTDGLPHNKISDIFVDSKGTAWIATRANGLYSVNSDNEYRITGNFVLEFIAITEDDNGNLWAATNNDGVFKFNPETDTAVFYSTHNGLKSGSCYSILNDGKGNIWVGHRLGLSKINVETGRVLTYGIEEGISGDCYHNAADVTDDARILFGTTSGLITFNSLEERKNLTAPFVNITSVRISDRDYDFSKPIILPYGIYKLRVDFIGLNFRSPERVTYQYRLEGYDEWSEPTSIPFVH